jgi:hypothetical protein
MNRSVRAYLAEIGRRGGRKSRRVLDPETAQAMVRVREARRVEREYRARISAMSIVERVRRSENLFNWSRDYMARSIVAARGPMPDDELRWEVALRQYGADPAMRRLIDELRGHAPR